LSQLPFHGRSTPVLVLTRRPNQSIMIGDDIVVTVLEVKGDQIRLGIDAPRHVQVFREEVLVALQEANRSAVLGTGSAPAAPAPGRPGPGGGRALPATGTDTARPSTTSGATPGPRPVPQHPTLRSAGPRSAA
jgi:carbon storage regulator